MRSVAGRRRAVETACLISCLFLFTRVAIAGSESPASSDPPIANGPELSRAAGEPIWVADRTFETGEDVKPVEEGSPSSTPLSNVEKPSVTPQEAAPAPEGAPAPAAENAPSTGVAPTRADGLVYPVSTFVVEYAQEHPNHPPIEELQGLEVELTRTDQGYIGPRPGAPTERMRIGRPADSPPAPFYGSAIRAVGAAIIEEYNRRGLVGALVIPSKEDVDPRSSRDLRPPDRTSMRLVVWTGRLAEQRTFASGSRFPQNERVDNPAHASIKERSPIQPGDLLDKRALDEYVARLNRHPGRNVDVAITRGSQPGNVYLDYLVAENPRPYSAYFQLSDTGTEGTDRWRERFGFGHNQLTGHDDLLQLDYITSGFDELNAVFGSYEIPLGFASRELDRFKVRAQGSWSEFTASEIGFQSSNFKGKQWHAGGQLILNVYQQADWFFDAYTGARYQHIWNKNEPLPDFSVFDNEGTANFFFPEVGARVEHRTDTFMFLAGVSGELNVPDVAGTTRSELEDMGRTDVTDNNFQILRWQASTSFYLEPLFTRASERRPTRVAEIFLSGQGQFTDDRLIPYHQAVAGGLNTVRGYPQSKVAGDTVYLWRSEFRLHLPRLLPPRSEGIPLPWGNTFYASPPQAYGLPDWDFIVRPFLDGGVVLNNHPDVRPDGDIEGELTSADMLGAGIGVELQLFHNLIVRGDWGRALTSDAGTPSGHNSYYFSLIFVL